MNSKYQICYCKKDFITHSLTFGKFYYFYFETDFDEPNDSVWVIYNEIGDQGILNFKLSKK